MRIGIDFDNTIACYDGTFHAAAVERGLIPAETGRDKTSVRDYLHGQGREADFTALQGYVYGPGMRHAAPFAGLFETLRRLREAGHDLVLVSHKTKTPFAGPAYDLHAAARGFLAEHRLVGEVFPAEDIWFELTKAEKAARIAAAGCEAFVDDLPEILAMPEFPAGTRRILFDPDGHYQGGAWKGHRFESYARWPDIGNALLSGRG